MKRKKERSLEAAQAVQQIRLDFLLVENDNLIADILRTELRHYRAEVHPVDELEETFHFLEGKKLDAVLVDLNHPTIDPLHLITATRNSASNSKVPIIVLVSSDEIDLLERASSAGATHFLSKPIVRQQLHELMESLHWSMADERRNYRRPRTDFPVLCTFEGRKISGRCINISASGMQLELEEELPPGAQILTIFPHSEQKPASFFLPTRVVRTVKGDDGQKKVGVKFINIPEETAEKLLMWVDLFNFFDEGVVTKPDSD